MQPQQQQKSIGNVEQEQIEERLLRERERERERRGEITATTAHVYD